MLNKRMFASAVLSVSIAAPMVTPTAQASETHLGCAQLQKGSDFDTPNIEGHLDDHLRRACKLSAEQVKALSLDDLKKVAEELGYVNQAINVGLLHAYASAGEPAQDRGDRAAGDSARKSLDSIYLYPVKAGDTAVKGQAWLHTPGQTRTVSAFFLAQVTSANTAVTNQQTDRPEIIDFTIQIPGPYVPKAGDVIRVGFEGDTSSQKQITVDAAPSLEEETPAPKPSPAPEAPAPHNPVPEKSRKTVRRTMAVSYSQNNRRTETHLAKATNQGKVQNPTLVTSLVLERNQIASHRILNCRRIQLLRTRNRTTRHLKRSSQRTSNQSRKPQSKRHLKNQGTRRLQPRRYLVILRTQGSTKTAYREARALGICSRRWPQSAECLA